MEVPVCRFRLGRALGEASLVVLLSLLGTTPMVPELWPRLSSPPLLFLPGAGLAVFLLLLFSALRWRAQFRIDEQGLEFRHTPGRITTRPSRAPSASGGGWRRAGPRRRAGPG